MATTTSIPCQFFFAQRGPNGEALPGTMFSAPTQKPLINTACSIVSLPPYQIKVPDGKSQCRFPNNNRYFYLYNKFTNAVVPDSLYTLVNQAPPSWCQSNGYQVLEFIAHS